MDDKYLGILEYFKIVEQLAGYTSFSAGRELALALRPSTEVAEVRRSIQETTEAKALLAVRTDVSLGAAHDVRLLVRRATLGATLQPRDLLDIRSTLLSARTLYALINRLKAEYPLLAELAGQLQPLPEVVEEITRCLDDDGRVRDSASPELARIRRESAIARERLVDRLRRIVTSSDNARFLQDALVTERNGRYVVPLKVEFKGRIPGIIHDQSGSGATLFIEPLETVELNNQWQELQLEEQREIERILVALTDTVAQEAEAINLDVELLAQLDLALAKGRYSFALKAAPAILFAERWPTAEIGAELMPGEHPLNLIRARHPLLPRETAVPINVYLGGNYTILVVTGPNTGGKTVSLKTVGLLAAMSQAGMHIPAMDGSKLPVFAGIYADIGDEQSIEQSLSTFSSHMSHIVDILGRADAGSLVLLDELGAGTDPVEGAALAQALIATFIARRCLMICSTHYSQLKIYAFSTPGVQNASVEFDIETLSPTFNLVIGLPGRSNALAIAQKLGLAEEIIAQAQHLVSPEDLQMDVLLERVKAAREAAEGAQTEAEERLARAQEMERELRRKLAAIEEARRQVLEQAREEGRGELEHLREEIRRIRTALTQPRSAAAVSMAPLSSAVQEAYAAIERLDEELAPLEAVTEPMPPTSEKLREGDTVYITTLGQTGELLSLGDQEAEVRVGGFRLRTRPSALQFRARPQPTAPQATEITVRSARWRAAVPAESPGMELDMRGWRAEEVAPALDRYLDNAYLAGLPWAQIIHGKGMGVLKEVVRQFLTNHPLVASFRPGALNEGGDGVTVVQLQKRSE